MTEEEIIRNQFTSILNNLVNNKIAPTGTAILSAQQPMILLFEELIYKINKQDTEINSLKETIQKQEKSREHLKKQFKGEINKLNNVIDDLCNDISKHWVENPNEIKQRYFMKEDK